MSSNPEYLSVGFLCIEDLLKTNFLALQNKYFPSTARNVNFIKVVAILGWQEIGHLQFAPVLVAVKGKNWGQNIFQFPRLRWALQSHLGPNLSSILCQVSGMVPDLFNPDLSHMALRDGSGPVR